MPNKNLNLSYFLLLLLCIFCNEGFSDAHNYKRVMLDINNRNNFCLMHIPKNGSTTIRNVIGVTDLFPYSKVEDELFKYEKLIVIRNPLYRAVSIYNEVMKLRRDGPYLITLQSEFFKHRADPQLSFKLFLEEIENNFYDPHMTHQYKVLFEKGLSIEDMDYIFLFEKLDTDMDLFCKKHGLNFYPSYENKTPNERKQSLKKYIDNNSSIQEKIYRIWKEDFIFYNNAKKVRAIVNSQYLITNGG